MARAAGWGRGDVVPMSRGQGAPTRRYRKNNNGNDEEEPSPYTTVQTQTPQLTKYAKKWNDTR